MEIKDLTGSLPVHPIKKPSIRKSIKRLVVHTTDWEVTPEGLAQYDIGPNHISQTGCLAPGSRILTPDGYKNIEDFRIGDKVIAPKTHNSCSVLAVHSREINEEVYELEFSLENTAKITATEEHPFLVFQAPKCNVPQKKKNCLPLSCKTKKYLQNRYSNLSVCAGSSFTEKDILSGLKWIPASELREGDLSATFLGKRKRVQETLTLEYTSLLWLAGLYLADGWPGRNNEVYIAVNTLDVELQTEIELAAKHLSIPFSRRNRKGCFEYRLGGGIFNRIKVIIKGSSSEQKKLSSLYMEASKEEQQYILDGYIAGDGYKTSDSVKIVTTSEELAHQMFILFARQGHIPCKYLGRGPRVSIIEGRKVLCAQEYIVSYRTNPVYSLGMIVGDYILFPIKKIRKKQYKGQIYNLTVDKEESYIVNSISTHNCPTITYTYLIGRSGEVFKTAPHEVVTWHVGNWNSDSLGIALVYKTDPDYERAMVKTGKEPLHVDRSKLPSKEQFLSLQKLLTKLCLELKVSPTEIYGHRELSGTGHILNSKGSKVLRKTCPGMGVDLDTLRETVFCMVQLELKNKGLYSGEIDGKWGPKSKAAFAKLK